MRPAPSSCAHKRLTSDGDDENMYGRYNIIIVVCIRQEWCRIIVTCRERSMLLFGSNEDVLPFCASAYVCVCVCVYVHHSSGPDSRQTIFSKIKGLNLSTVSRPFKNGQQDTSGGGDSGGGEDSGGGGGGGGGGGDPGFSRVSPGICFGRQLFFFQRVI